MKRTKAINKNDVAILSSFNGYTTFTYGGVTLTFKTCKGSEKYTKVLTWENGYIEVLAKYRQNDKEIEEYIDLDPILNDLYMDRDSFLKNIKNVRIDYA